MRRSAAIIASLIVPPAGPLILGHYRRVVTSFLVEVLALATVVTGAYRSSQWLMALAIAIALLNRAAMMRASLSLKPAPGAPIGLRAALLVVAVFAAEHGMSQLARAYLVEAFKIPTASMIPTLQIGDHVFIDKRKVQPTRGDVIVFKYPREPDKDFIKRVIAVGGDRVEWQDEMPVVNGTPILRKAIDGDCRYRDYNVEHWEERACRAFQETLDGRSWRIFQDRAAGGRPFAPLQVPPGNYYVVGDNRDNSHDSRYWGAVPAENVKGTAIGIYYSFDTDVHWERFGQVVR